MVPVMSVPQFSSKVGQIETPRVRSNTAHARACILARDTGEGG